MNGIEEWRVIAEFPEYDVSSFGQVRRNCPDRHGRNAFRILKSRQSKTRNNALMIEMTNDHGKSSRYVARLMCEAFFGPDSGKHARPIDGDHLNCVLSNFKWKDGIRGSEVFSCKLNEELVRQIRASVETLAVIARQFGVSPLNVRRIRARKTWRHVA